MLLASLLSLHSGIIRTSLRRRQRGPWHQSCVLPPSRSITVNVTRAGTPHQQPNQIRVALFGQPAQPASVPGNLRMENLVWVTNKHSRWYQEQHGSGANHHAAPLVPRLNLTPHTTIRVCAGRIKVRYALFGSTRLSEYVRACRDAAAGRSSMGLVRD
jgi:hypothetical protein